MCCQDVPDARAIRQIKTRYRTLAPVMDERLRRQWAASEAQSYGRGGVSAVSSATGMSRNTIRKGIAETVLRKKNPKAVVSTRDRKSTRLNSSHGYISYAVFCLKKKKTRDKQVRNCKTKSFLVYAEVFAYTHYIYYFQTKSQSAHNYPFSFISLADRTPHTTLLY